MGKTITIECDGCGKDVATSTNSIDFRLAILNQRIPTANGPVTDMMMYPVLDRDYYVCSKICLDRVFKKLLTEKERNDE